MSITILLVTLGICTFAGHDERILKEAIAAYESGDHQTARRLAESYVKDVPSSAVGHAIRGSACLALRDYPEAIASLSQAIKLAPKEATFLDSRGDAYLKSGEITKAIVDYDAALKLFPKEAAAHQWRLGIALYYAERFLDGVKQFEIHKTVNPEDVENAVWHYLCLAKVAGAEKARDSFIAVNKDQRVPMREIHRLYAGQGTQAEVLKSAESQPADTRAGRSARFYAHLYISLWHESQNEPKLALEHMKQAVEKYQIGDYMYDVAKMHLQLRSKAKP